jgi:branched-chain amino acid transport system ATP-binding protein
MTVRENLIAARYLKSKYGLLGSYFQSVFRSNGYRDEERRLIKKSDEILAFFEMGDRADAIAANLPSVDQRKLEIAIALAVEPRLLLLDEPAAGMNPKEIDRLLPLIQSINQSGISLLVIEHNMKVIMGICTRVVVLNYGTKICDGTCEEVANDQKVISSYLGKAL